MAGIDTEVGIHKVIKEANLDRHRETMVGGSNGNDTAVNDNFIGGHL